MKEFKEIADSEGIVLRDMSEPFYDAYKKSIGKDFKNISWAFDKKEIYLGTYDNPTHQRLAFFHELGHCVQSTKVHTRLENELDAWYTGIQLAKKYRYIFSNEDMKYVLSRLKSYSK
jgi:hypothetical protein